MLTLLDAGTRPVIQPATSNVTPLAQTTK